MNKAQEKNAKRMTRKRRIRSRVHGTAERPRLAVFRSNRFVYAQIINDDSGETIVGMSTRDIKNGSAESLGSLIAETAKKNGVTKVVFDRGGYLFAGQIKKLADAAREAGLEF